MCNTERYKEFCERRFDAIDAALRHLNDQLFMDNGGDCLQSKVNENRRWIKILTGVFAAIGTFTLSVIGWIVKQHYVE